MSYEEKYLKYKQKYLSLKGSLKINLKGGVQPLIQNSNNVLLVSHNGRMRCFIDSLKNIEDDLTDKPVDNIMKYKLGTSGEKEIRFMNGAVLKVSLFKNSDLGTIELFYQGNVNNRKPGLYFTEVGDSVKGDITFGKYTFNYVQSFGINQLTYDVNFYIVRHGEGTHNLKDKLKSVKFITRTGTDPKLTTDGENQANGAGLKFLNSGIKFNKIFVSRLERTKQTAYLILKSSNNLTNQTVLTVLPCSHELLYSKSGNCDKSNAMMPVAPENVSNCEHTNKTYTQCTECCTFTMTYFDKNKADTNDIMIKVDWNGYNKFYYENKGQCRDTNFIIEALKLISM